MGSINIRGNALDPKTGNKDPDYAFCFDFKQKKVQKFDICGPNGNERCPFCADIGDVPCANPPTATPLGKGKGKGRGKGKGTPPTPCTCPGVLSNTPSSAPRDEL